MTSSCASPEEQFEGLTAGERIRLWRARKKLTRDQVARLHGVTWRTIAQAERNERPWPGHHTPWTGERALRLHEQVQVYRWRAGVSQMHVAAELGISRLWVNRMEKGTEDCSRLKEYWEQ